MKNQAHVGDGQQVAVAERRLRDLHAVDERVIRAAQIAHVIDAVRQLDADVLPRDAIALNRQVAALVASDGERELRELGAQRLMPFARR
jgi:hypothetical protein